MGEIFPLERPQTAMTPTGERFVLTAERGQIEIEHIHRYYLARHLCRGKDVLDVASGEGYGSALLAQTARSVTGVDVSEEAVIHAQQNYVKANLAYRKGNGTALPLEDAAVDMVVSFETIEHLYDHGSFLDEIRRVLRPGGQLILSTPDRDIYSPPDQKANPFHVHELTRREFAELIRGRFRNTRFFGQRAMIGSAIMVDEPMQRTELPVVFEQRGETHAESSEGLARSTYLICVASDDPIGKLPESLFVQNGNIGKIFADLDALEHTTKWLRSEVDKRIQHAEQERAAAHEAFRKLHRNLSLVETRLSHSEQDRAALRGALAQTDLAVTAVQAERDQRESELRAAHAQILAAHAHTLATQQNYAAQLCRMRRLGLLQTIRALPRQRRRLRRIAQALRASELFDRDWYLAQYDDVRAGGMDPVPHYARFGADEGRDPGPKFSTNYYVLTYPDVISSDYNPLEHYELFGRAEGRQPTPPPASEPAAEQPEAPPDRMISEETAPKPEGAMALDFRVAFVSGEPHTPGHTYRVERYAAAARTVGAKVTVQTVAEAAEHAEAVTAADLVVIWRAEWNAAVERVIVTARQGGAVLLFDVDDLMFDPQYARIDVIDGIRSQGLTEEEVRGFYGRIRKTMLEADFCSATTPFLAAQMRYTFKPVFILPNGFDEPSWRAARLAVRTRRAGPPDGLVRLGYPAGSRTHQKDFAMIAPAVGRVLREDPNRRLVLFKREIWPILDMEEFPSLQGLEAQIEWRQMVPVAELPTELARFDINLAPVEVGNPFCEAKSELKYFEAALVAVPSICSPTQVHRDAVRDGETGILAAGEEAWFRAMTELLADPALRNRMAQAAYHDVLWTYGPERRADLLKSVLDQVLRRGREAARAFELDLARRSMPRAPLLQVPESETILLSDQLAEADVTVIVPLYNYHQYVVEALESVREQSLQALHLVVIDDCSTDHSLAVAQEWMERHRGRFGRLLLLRNKVNSGLGPTRNTGFAAAETPFVLQLDADNKLLPDCAARCLEAIGRSGAAFVYPTLQQFGESGLIFSNPDYDPATLIGGNYIDATALVRLSAWAGVGGYQHVRFGWEDYDLWCRFAERGMFGQHVRESLALYRVHRGSMLRTVTELDENKQQLITNMRARHPWILEGLDIARIE